MARKIRPHQYPQMAKIVMKFGGTSVADIERIRNVAKLVKREVDRGSQVGRRRLGDGRRDE
jgi:aspartate kinase